jgi:basic membrane protein A
MKIRSLALFLLVLVPAVLTACQPKSANCIQPDVFCVGLVGEVGPLEDRAFNQSTWQGLEQARANGTADWIASIETKDRRDYLENLRTFAEAGYDVIVAVGSGSSDALYTAAGQFPNSFFIGVDQPQPEEQTVLRNLTRLSFPEEQLGFLAGALAAMLSETGRVGAVCASDLSPAMLRYGSGFTQGAEYIDAEVSATVVFNGQTGLADSFADPEWGAETANTLIDSGVDVIFGVGGTTGNNAIVAAAMRGVYGIGADNDQYYNLPVAAPRILSSVLKDIPDGVDVLLQLARAAQRGEAIFPAGSSTGQVALAPYHDLDQLVPDEVKTRMEDLLHALIAGEIQTGTDAPLP